MISTLVTMATLMEMQHTNGQKVQLKIVLVHAEKTRVVLDFTTSLEALTSCGATGTQT